MGRHWQTTFPFPRSDARQKSDLITAAVLRISRQKELPISQRRFGILVDRHNDRLNVGRNFPSRSVSNLPTHQEVC
jgi:hypothetical protein